MVVVVVVLVVVVVVVAVAVVVAGFSLGSWKSGPMAHPGRKIGPFLDNIAPMVQHVSDWLQINYSTSRTPPSSHPSKKRPLYLFSVRSAHL